MTVIIEKFRKAFSITQGSVLGGVLFLSGGCIGAGMLALPISTGLAGALPTLLVFVLSILFMTATALLMVEVIAIFGYRGINLLTLTENTLGKTGRRVAWTTFVFLLFSLLVAYITKGGEMVQELLQKSSEASLPSWLGPFSLSLATALFLSFGTAMVDHFNRWCMYFLFGSLACFFTCTMNYTNGANLAHHDWSHLVFIIPFIIVSFGYHNMVPTVYEYLNGDQNKLIKTISYAGLICLLVYSTWTFIIQAIIPLTGIVSIETSFARGEIATEPLGILIPSPMIQISMKSLAFFAIITSLLGQSLSMIDFLSEGLKIEKTAKGRAFLSLLIFLPSFCVSQSFPGIFFLALEFAGGILAMILFGVLPVLMAWSSRYRKKPANKIALVPGGKGVLILLLTFSLLVITYEVGKHFL